MAKTNTNEDFIELTKEAYDKLVEELEYRTTVEREEIAKEIKDARDLGDLSENQPYTLAMERKERNENRISELEDMVKKAKVIQNSTNKNVVQIGSTVEITNLQSKSKMKVTLVGSEETQSADPSEGKISIDSPIGKAIYNAKIGEEVEVELPGRSIRYKVEKLGA